MKKVLAVLAVAGLASSAMAQTFEARFAFNNTHANNRNPIDGPLVVDQPGDVALQALFGAFNAQGFTNRGMFNAISTITISDPAGTARLILNDPALRNPYNFGSVARVNDDGSIYFDANRGTGQVNVPWEDGEPRPDSYYTYPDNQGGPDNYFAGLRFFLNPGDGPLVARDVTITISGSMQAISEWFVLGGEEGDSVDLLPAGWVQEHGTATFVVSFVPAPGAAALLGLGGLVASRRRRA